MTPVALTFAVLSRWGASELGVVLAAETVPLICLLLVGGAVSDRLSRQTVMIASDALRAVSQCALGAWIILGSPSLIAFMVFSCILGIGQAFFSPALSGLVKELLSPAEIQQGNALNGLASSVGVAVGPALAGVIIAFSNPGVAIAVDGATYIASALLLLSIRIRWPRIHTDEGMMRLMKDGWAEFTSRTWLWVSIVGFSLINVFIFAPFLVLGPTLADAYLGGARSWGFIASAEGIGSIAGGLAMMRKDFRRPLFVALLCALVWTIPLALLAVEAPLSLLLPSALLSGISLSVLSVLWSTTVQREVPAECLSRVSSYDWFGSLALLPIGMAVIGPLSTTIGIVTTMVASIVAIVIVVLVMISLPSIWRLKPEPRASVRD